MPPAASSPDEDAGPALATLAFACRGSLVVFVNLKDAPSEKDWNTYLDATEKQTKKVGALRYYVSTGGGAPNALQRKRAAQIDARSMAKVAIVSDHFVARAVAHALALFNPNTRAFASNETTQAYAFLELGDEEAAWVTMTVSRLREALEHRASG